MPAKFVRKSLQAAYSTRGHAPSNTRPLHHEFPSIPVHCRPRDRLVVSPSPYPQEFDLLAQVLTAHPKDSPEHLEALRMRERAVSEKGFHYHGSAKFFLLNGDALARSLAGLMAK